MITYFISYKKGNKSLHTNKLFPFAQTDQNYKNIFKSSIYIIAIHLFVVVLLDLASQKKCIKDFI